MKTLLILRHAKSSWDNPALTDHERPLNKRGRKAAPRMGQLLADEGLVPDLILSSTAERARATADLVAERSGYDGEVLVTDELYLAPPSAYFGLIGALNDAHNTVMVVGHNPGISEFVTNLTGESTEMVTAALAHTQMNIESWRDLQQRPIAERRLLAFQ